MEIAVLKFGGTSMGSAESIRRCVRITASSIKKQRTVVVVSAVAGVTDGLIGLIQLARKQKQRLIAGRINQLEEKHREILKEFVPAEKFETVWEGEFLPLWKKLRYLLTGISFVGELTDKTYAFICSFGERFSARIMHHALLQAGIQNQKVHAKRLIRTDSNYLEATVDFKRTKETVKRVLLPLVKHQFTPVVTGFVGKDTHGDITLLGRGGTDYTASILGVCLRASEVQIWTDVDGVMSADPKVVPDVRTWPTINLSVMAEMAHGGAKVLHPKTITAAVEESIPVFIKNTFRPEVRGTLVTTEEKKGIRGIVAEKGQMLLHVTNPHMLDTFGFIQECSDCFVNSNVPIDVCATSEITVTFSLREKDFSPKLEKALGKIARVEKFPRLAKICVIGYQITQDAKLLADIFAALRKYRIYTVSIGASFHNVTILLERDHADEVVRALHSHLFSR